MRRIWMLSEIKYDAAELLRAGNGASLSPADRMETAIGIAFERAMARLPMDAASELYCDIDSNYPDYVEAVEAVLAGATDDAEPVAVSYFDILAACPNQNELRADIAFLLDCNRAMDCESVRDEWMEFDFTRYKESQAHILINVITLDDFRSATVDEFLEALKGWPVDFNTGSDFPGWYFDERKLQAFKI